MKQKKKGGKTTTKRKHKKEKNNKKEEKQQKEKREEKRGKTHKNNRKKGEKKKTNTYSPQSVTTTTNTAQANTQARAGALMAHRPVWVGHPTHGWVPVKTHSAPVPTSVGRLWVAPPPPQHTTMSPRKRNTMTQNNVCPEVCRGPRCVQYGAKR